MSLRTKLLAAVIGLHGAFLLLALYWLVREEQATPDPSRDLRLLASEIDGARSPEDRERARARLLEMQRARLVADVYLVEAIERGPRAVTHRVFAATDALAGTRTAIDPDGDAAKQAVLQFQEARRVGDTEWFATVLPSVGGTEIERVRRGLVATTPPAGTKRRGIQAAYLVLIGGVVVLSGVAFFLVSRLVTRRLALLTSAADRIAAGDYRLDLEHGALGRSGSHDEIDRTIAAFQRMAREIGEYQGHLEDRVLSALGRIRKAEQHLAIAQRLAATGKLASGVAHEINNPLGGMKNAVRALARGDLTPEKQREYLDLVSDGLGRVEETVKKFLSFTPRRVEPRPTDLADVARKALALAQHRIEKKGIRVVERFAPPGGAVVFGDPHELMQVALNLFLNAADAVPEGRPGTIEVTASRSGDDVVLAVADDGVGMTPEDQARCFDLFFTTKEVGEGTGLGLAVVHNVVTNHGGRIEVESAPGRGTTFRVVLPGEAAPDEVAAVRPS
jgi:signal transduction histidine kinase